MKSGRAPGKIILLGEHAVVYARPAIAIPVNQVSARAEILTRPETTPGHIWIEAPDIQFSTWLHKADLQHPLIRAVELGLQEIGPLSFPAFSLRIESDIPIAAGLGSGAAVTIAILRALSAFFDAPLSLERQSRLAYEVETLHHGTPSGIDNTVVTFGQPIYFQRGAAPQTLQVTKSIHFTIADSGIAAPTARAVAKVRDWARRDRQHAQKQFDAIGEAVMQARQAIEHDDLTALGNLMNQNQTLLQTIGVSAPHLETLIQAALDANALGAKLSGAGLGGNVIALVDPSNAESVADALRAAGATRVIQTQVDP